MDKFKITQIIPAPGNLYAVFTDGEAPVPVLCLALWTDANGETGVSGMVAFGYEGLGFAEDCENFLPERLERINYHILVLSAATIL